MRFVDNLTFRLTVLNATAACLAVIVALSLAYYLTVVVPLNSVKDQLRREVAALAAVHQAGGPARLSEALWDRRHREAARYPFDTLIDARGMPLTGNLPSWPETRTAEWLHIEADLHLDGQEEDRDALVLDHRFADGSRLLLGRNVEDLDDLDEELRHVAGAFLPITALLALFGGALISRSVGRRIEALDSAARRIMGSTLSERVPIAGKNDDIDRLAMTLNRMLRRLEVAVEGLHRTSDSIAHELRTPLARLRSHIEELAAGASPSEESLSQALAEIETLGAVFDAVLAITRLESGGGSVTFERVDVSRILADAADLYAGVAEDRDIRFHTDIDGDLHAHGNPNLLLQSACNLLDNAIKYTPAGGEVSIEATSVGDEILVSISDSGPGIPDELHRLVFQRFYRAPATADVPGLGMGLPFVAAVNAIHNASLSLNSANGLCVEWRIPRETRM